MLQMEMKSNLVIVLFARLVSDLHIRRHNSPLLIGSQPKRRDVFPWSKTPAATCYAALLT